MSRRHRAEDAWRVPSPGALTLAGRTYSDVIKEVIAELLCALRNHDPVALARTWRMLIEMSGLATADRVSHLDGVTPASIRGLGQLIELPADGPGRPDGPVDRLELSPLARCLNLRSLITVISKGAGHSGSAAIGPSDPTCSLTRAVRAATLEEFAQRMTPYLWRVRCGLEAHSALPFAEWLMIPNLADASLDELFGRSPTSAQAPPPLPRRLSRRAPLEAGSRAAFIRDVVKKHWISRIHQHRHSNRSAFARDRFEREAQVRIGLSPDLRYSRADLARAVAETWLRDQNSAWEAVALLWLADELKQCTYQTFDARRLSLQRLLVLEPSGLLLLCYGEARNLIKRVSEDYSDSAAAQAAAALKGFSMKAKELLGGLDLPVNRWAGKTFSVPCSGRIVSMSHPAQIRSLRERFVAAGDDDALLFLDLALATGARIESIVNATDPGFEFRHSDPAVPYVVLYRGVKGKRGSERRYRAEIMAPDDLIEGIEARVDSLVKQRRLILDEAPNHPVRPPRDLPEVPLASSAGRQKDVDLAAGEPSGVELLGGTTASAIRARLHPIRPHDIRRMGANWYVLWLYRQKDNRWLAKAMGRFNWRAFSSMMSYVVVLDWLGNLEAREVMEDQLALKMETEDARLLSGLAGQESRRWFPAGRPHTVGDVLDAQVATVNAWADDTLRRAGLEHRDDLDVRIVGDWLAGTHLRIEAGGRPVCSALLLSQAPATKRDAVLLCREIHRLRESTPLILCTPGGRPLPAVVMRAVLRRKCTVCGPDMVVFIPGAGRTEPRPAIAA